MRLRFFYAAVVGWAIGLIVHFTALLADHDLSIRVPGVRLLHLGAIVLFGAGILYIRKDHSSRDPTLNRSWLSFYKTILGRTPVWLLVLAGTSWIYTIAQGSMSLDSFPGSLAVRDGEYILHNHGQLIRALSESEYMHYRALEIGRSSSGWIGFYGIAAVMLHPRTRTVG